MNETQIMIRARDLLDDHGFKHWRIEFSETKEMVAYCDYKNQRLVFSRCYVGNPTTRWENVITHEVAHAIVGPGYGHGITWQRTHRFLGGDGERCQKGTTLAPEHFKWRVECSVDGSLLGRVHRRGKALARGVCRCHGKPPVWIEQ